HADSSPPVANMLSANDALLVTTLGGQVLIEKNASLKSVPASTLKLLTALAAFHYLGPSYRFQTAIHLDARGDLKIKGYGDPLLISEVWEHIARALASRIRVCNDVVVDDSYFSQDVHIPGAGNSTNPYDAPIGALCANFNTVFFETTPAGKIVSAEPQTPITPLALAKVRRLGLHKGRVSFSHNGDEIARYAGEVLSYFLRARGVVVTGRIRQGRIRSTDRLIYSYRSPFTLKEAVRKMLKYSNNFMANQITVALGAHVSGPPGTLEKGVAALSRYAATVLHLDDIQIVEGSGISRDNRLTAQDMLVVLQAFAPYRDLLTRKGPVLFKSGTLAGIRTRAGYIAHPKRGPCPFVLFLRGTQDIKVVLKCLVNEIKDCQIKDPTAAQDPVPHHSPANYAPIGTSANK
ncbi:MAG: D-alanyl-D-alanine carboxypeptidase, partial [Deltaproteobacteria bacterium]|nr:D-alanyl-D-alanine carboxypeptidase [Deltaproteobacteria bacterium]